MKDPFTSLCKKYEEGEVNFSRVELANLSNAQALHNIAEQGELIVHALLEIAAQQKRQADQMDALAKQQQHYTVDFNVDDGNHGDV